ncbi:MAG: NAD(P)H-dependent glycerol-3-phosphate dehydrogenase [Anaeromyxobacter sp.]
MSAHGLDLLVVGGGSFGTAMAHALAAVGRRVQLWVRRPELAEEINGQHTSQAYAPGARLAEGLTATTALGPAVREARVVLVAVPSRSFREVAAQLGEHLRGDQLLLHGTKGIEIGTGRRMTQILREETCCLKLGVLSGPNLAAEIMAGQPAGALVASRYDEVVAAVQALFAGSWVRVYGGRDVVGTEVGGSFKNVIALAAGVVDGLGLGDNSKALVITRGLSEMAQYGVALGADVFTFGGLAGIGDLIATCASELSRNHQVGERLGRGEPLEDILASLKHVAEGVPTALAVQEEALRRGLELPIAAAVHATLREGRSAREAMQALMSRPVRGELARLRFQ